jgi:hypothetical protein
MMMNMIDQQQSQQVDGLNRAVGVIKPPPDIQSKYYSL